MIGNAVPVKFAEVIARQIKRDIDEYIASSAQID
jgi:site-specific DNA-cytosine methylase